MSWDKIPHWEHHANPVSGPLLLVVKPAYASLTRLKIQAKGRTGTKPLWQSVPELGV